MALTQAVRNLIRRAPRCAICWRERERITCYPRFCGQNVAPFAENPCFETALEKANSYRIESLAHATMLNHYGERILASAHDLPVIMVKGAVFARTIYPKAALRPFTDIDLLVDPGAIPRLNTLLLDEGFGMVEDGAKDGSMQSKWTHRRTGALIEVHGNLVHMPRLRAAFSLAYDVLGGNAQTPAALLTVAVVHGATHYFAWLKHVVDLCQAARAVRTTAEEARFEALTARTRTRFPAILGLYDSAPCHGWAALLRHRQGTRTDPPYEGRRAALPWRRSHGNHDQLARLQFMAPICVPRTASIWCHGIDR